VTAWPILIAQISDLHIKPRGVLAYRRVDTAAALAACVRELTGFGLRYTAARDNCNNVHCRVTGKSLRPAA
jgi:hypothetical protein